MANRPYDAGQEPRPGEQASENDRRYARFLDALVRAGLGSRERCEQITVAVLVPLEQRITGPEARDLNLELPWHLRELVRSRGGERHPRSRPAGWGRDEYLARVREELHLEEAEVERTVRTVLEQVRTLLSEKEASDVIGQLPPDLQGLWAPLA